MLVSYAVLIVLYFLPVAAYYIATNIAAEDSVIAALDQIGMASPLMTCFQVPLDTAAMALTDEGEATGSWPLVLGYFTFTLVAIAAMFAVIAAFLRNRWGMTGR